MIEYLKILVLKVMKIFGLWNLVFFFNDVVGIIILLMVVLILFFKDYFEYLVGCCCILIKKLRYVLNGVLYWMVKKIYLEVLLLLLL